jgi:hypothetical protein
MSIQYEYVKAWRNRTKSRSIKSFDNKCGICNYDKCSTALEFHHIDPDGKDFSISSMKYLNWSTIVIELRKCICVCANCHREIHSGITKIPDNIKRFDETYAVYEPKIIIEYDNCVCGKTKPKRFKFCSQKCACQKRSKIDWDKIDLVDLVFKQKLTLTNLAKTIGVTDNSIRKRLVKLGLPCKRKQINDYVNRMEM